MLGYLFRRIMRLDIVGVWCLVLVWALSDLDANNCAVVTEKITLENEGWERDTSVTEPVQT
jgi:hypothetical protein